MRNPIFPVRAVENDESGAPRVSVPDPRRWPLDGTAELLAALAAPCGCEIGERYEDCVGPLDRWWLAWARGEDL